MSKRYTLNTIDWMKIGKGCLIASAGAILTYLTDMIPLVDFGQYTPVVVAIWSIVVNAVNKFIKTK